MIEARTSLSQPSTVAVALWLGAWLRGAAGADDLVDVLGQAVPDCPVRAAAPGDSLHGLLGGLRSDEITAAWPLLPRPGRPLGWPRHVPEEPQPGVLPVGADRTARGVLLATPSGWQRLASAEPESDAAAVLALLAEALAPRAAIRRFTDLVTEATAELAALGLDRPATAQRSGSWEPALRRLPHGSPGALIDLLHRIATVLDALELALGDDGAAVTAGEAAARAGHLRRLHGDLTDLVVSAIVGNAVGPSLTS